MMPDDPSSASPPEPTGQSPLPVLPVEDESSPASNPPAPQLPSEPIEPPPEEPLPPITFWQQPFVQNVVPVLTSLAFHLGLILLGVLTYKALTQAHTVSQEQVIVPDAAIVQGDVGGIPNPGLGGDPNRKSASDLAPENTRSDAWNRQPSKLLQQAVLGGQGETKADTVIGVGSAQSLGKGTGLGLGSGQGDAAAPFGVPGGGSGVGPAVKFIGVSGNARTVCYVCDASGSMMGLPFDLLKIELHKAVDVLVPVQAFDIVLFQKGIAVPFSPQKLVVANQVNKSRAFQWLDQQTVGSNSDPIAALVETFRKKPQLMYLLTDGAFDDNDAVVAELRKLNREKKTRINTIAFFSPDAPESDRKACEDVLRLIARENGGQFKVVYTSDLTRQ